MESSSENSDDFFENSDSDWTPSWMFEYSAILALESDEEN